MALPSSFSQNEIITEKLKAVLKPKDGEESNLESLINFNQELQWTIIKMHKEKEELSNSLSQILQNNSTFE